MFCKLCRPSQRVILILAGEQDVHPKANFNMWWKKFMRNRDNIIIYKMSKLLEGNLCPSAYFTH